MLNNGPVNGKEIYKKRRAKLFAKIQNGVAIIPSNPEMLRNNDVHYDYRQDSTHYYLSGFAEPESIVVLNPTGKNKYILFVREKNVLRERWDGFRYGIESAGESFGADHVYPISEFEKIVPEIIKDASKIYYHIGRQSVMDEKVLTMMGIVKGSRGRSGRGLQDICDIDPLVGELRLFKSKEELEDLRKACDISARGHIAAMRMTKPGMFEYQVQAEVERVFKASGSERLGYGSIVGCGANATTLHYVTNKDQCLDGDFMLIDAGAEFNYLTGDITRTYPVNGKFSPAQRKFYQVILDVQKSCIQMIKPGLRYSAIHTHAVEMLTEGMIKLGLLKGSVKSLIEKKEYLKYYPHGTGHWLGMDVHDSGYYQVDGESRRIEPGMCFTVEPGLYVPLNDKTAPKELRGLGVRIEDDIYVTAKGCENMTVKAPKEISEIEAIVGKG